MLRMISLVALLGGCASAPERALPVQVPVTVAPKHDWVGQIRSEAARSDSLIEVLPLADPAVADLSAQARAAEAAQAWDQVDTHLAAALAISPRDPELWQWRAEIALARQSWREAEHHARRSARLGPGLGALCVRNWLTLMAAASESGDDAAAAQAGARAARCPVPKPVRL